MGNGVIHHVHVGKPRARIHIEEQAALPDAEHSCSRQQPPAVARTRQVPQARLCRSASLIAEMA